MEDLHNYQLYLVDHGILPVSLNAAITGLKFFFDATADHPEPRAKMRPVHVQHTLPVVLSRDTCPLGYRVLAGPRVRARIVQP